MPMGTWKKRQLKQLLSERSRSTATSRARRYTAAPPPEGWPGGKPAENGYKHRGATKV